MNRARLLTALLVLAPADAAAQLDDVERRIAAYVDAHESEALELLERIASINSGSANLAGVKRVADVLAPELERLGFTVRWIALPASTRRAGHLVAERVGNRGRRVLLIGHLDTVYEEDSPFQRYVREGTTARGPGVADMKGGDVAIVLALQALHAAGALEDRTIRVIFTGDEESPGEPLDVSRRDLIELGRASDVALEFETLARDSVNDYAATARRGSSEWLLRVSGRTAHSSGIFSESVGAGAAFEAARILDDFYDQLRGEEYVNFSAGVILGGTEVSYDAESGRGAASGKTNVVPQSVVVHGGLRTISNDQLARARERMRAIVASHLPRTSAEIEFADAYPGMPPTEGNRALLRVYDRVSRDLGYGAVLEYDPGRRGASDLSFVAPFTDALGGLGVSGSGAHSPSESMDVTSLAKSAKRAAVMVRRLTAGDG